MKLYELASGGQPFIALRDDGLLVLQAPGPPQVYFPGDVRPVLLQLPPPRKLEKTYTPYDSLEKLFLFGEVLFYQRTAYPGDLMMGFVAFDAVGKSFVRNIAVSEVRDSIGGSETWAASLGSVPVRFREHILWLNRGQSNITGIWREQRLWAVDLKSGKLIREDAMPDELLMNPLKPLTRKARGKRVR